MVTGEAAIRCRRECVTSGYIQYTTEVQLQPQSITHSCFFCPSSWSRSVTLHILALLNSCLNDWLRTFAHFLALAIQFSVNSVKMQSQGRKSEQFRSIFYANSRFLHALSYIRYTFWFYTVKLNHKDYSHDYSYRPTRNNAMHFYILYSFL